MIDSPKTLWIDITDMFYWKGNFTGIQNVVDNYTQRFIENKTARLFIFEPPHNTYREVSTHEWSERREQILSIATSKVPPAQRRPLKDILRHHAAVRVKKVMPGQLKVVLRAQVEAYRKQKYQAAARHHPFNKGDTVLVIGGNWGDDFRGFAEGLVKIKEDIDIRLLHVVHDLIPLKYPNYYVPNSTSSFGRYFRALSKSGGVDGYFADSKSTASDVKSLIIKPGSVRPVEVIRLGEDFSPVLEPKKPRLDVVSGNFLLCVGTLEARKNHGLIYSVAKLAKQHKKAFPKIVIVGKKGWMETETLHNLTKDPDISDGIIVSHDITNAELAWLYQNCRFTLYPSYYEGWGLPIAESLHYGKLCLASNTSSMPEVGESYADYFSPFDAGELLDKILFYQNPENLHARERIISKRPPFTWDNSFEQFTNQVIKMVDTIGTNK
ncbi:MAG: glycosyltransferase family 1 protein [Patescibacteria group bacterium]|nr:glycosyltransferase family 1 protein [Patescibacteria group bacterium]